MISKRQRIYISRLCAEKANPLILIMGDGRISVSSHREDLIRHYETRCFEGPTSLVDWEVLTSTGTEVRAVSNDDGLSSVRSRRNECDLEGGTRGLLLHCDGMISTKPIFRSKLGKMSMKCGCKFTLKTTYTAMLTTQSKTKAGKTSAKKERFRQITLECRL